MRKLLLHHWTAPGDIVVMSAAIRDLALANPGKVAISLRTPCMELWRHNPHVSSVPIDQIELHRLSYGPIPRNCREQRKHFLSAFHLDLTRRTGLACPVTQPRPDLHLSEQEKSDRIVDGRYWVILSGGKTDYTCKHWVHARHQEVVDQLTSLGLRFVQVGVRNRDPKSQHRHQDLERSLNLLGRTNLRELMRLIYHADGVICGITAAMHMAAAFEKPCVVIGGGREEWWWEAYSRDNPYLPNAHLLKVSHRYLHTQDQLSCCQGIGCWMNKVTKDEPDKDKLYCKLPVQVGTQIVPECMKRIETRHVVQAAISYYLDGTLEDEKVMLPPIGDKLVVPLAGDKWLAVEARTTDAPAGLVTAPLPLELPQVASPTFGKAALPDKAARRKEREHGAPAPGRSLLDDPAIGGKITVFILFYGDYHQLHRRCLDTFLSTVPPDRIELRVASNAVCRSTRDYLDLLAERGDIAVHYRNDKNRFKYPVQRQLWHDPDRPIETKWLLWMDDDTVFDRRRDWLNELSRTIIANPDPTIGSVGPRQVWTLVASQLQWMKEAAWWRGRPLQDAAGKESPNGNKIVFATGSFFALKVEAMRKAGIPDVRLEHNGGDYLNGAALWQAGYSVIDFSSQKGIVNWSSVRRRGASQKHPGT